MNATIATLLRSDELAIRYKTLVHVLERDPLGSEAQRLQAAMQASSRVQLLLPERNADGAIPYHPYTKWVGAHWVLADLADLGYPPADSTLIALREQMLNWLLGESHRKGIRTIAGRVRRCASQEGNTLFGLLKLGLADERVDELAEEMYRKAYRQFYLRPSPILRRVKTSDFWLNLPRNIRIALRTFLPKKEKTALRKAIETEMAI